MAINTRGGVISAQEWAEKQLRRASAAADDWAKGVQNPRRDPIAAALAAAKKREEGVRRSLEQHKWEKSMQKVSSDDWLESVQKTGAAGYRRGIETKAHKVVKAVEELQPLVDQVHKEIQAMPQDTEDQRIQRLLAAREKMIDVGKKRRGIS